MLRKIGFTFVLIVSLALHLLISITLYWLFFSGHIEGCPRSRSPITSTLTRMLASPKPVKKGCKGQTLNRAVLNHQSDYEAVYNHEGQSFANRFLQQAPKGIAGSRSWPTKQLLFFSPFFKIILFLQVTPFHVSDSDAWRAFLSWHCALENLSSTLPLT